MNMKIKIDCSDRYGMVTAEVPEGWRVVNGKGQEKPMKGDKVFSADTKEFRMLNVWDYDYNISTFFKVIRRIHRKKVA